jgi:hypothetical protein
MIGSTRELEVVDAERPIFSRDGTKLRKEL